MNGQQQFYGEGYEPSYTPLMVNLVGARQNADWATNDYEAEAQSQTLPKRLSYSDDGITEDWDQNTAGGDATQTESDNECDQTSYQNELFETMNIKREEPDLYDSQIPPNQEFISKLDDLFDDSPQNVYIEKVLAYLAGKEGLLTWYRNILISRLRGMNDCDLFQNVPVTRKNTNKSSSAFKYARDCHTLSLFLKGDMTAQVDEIFTSRGHRPLISEKETAKQASQTPNSSEVASTKLLIQNLRLEIKELQKSHEDSTKKLNNTINTLEQKNTMLKHKLEKIENEFNSKITQYDTKLKLISSTLKDLEHLNAHEVNTKLDRLETSNKSLVSAITKMRASPKTTIVHNTAKTQITSNTGKNTLTPSSAHESSNIWRPMSFSDNTSVTTSSALVGGASITDRQQNSVIQNSNSKNHINNDVDKSYIQESTGQQPVTTASSNSRTQQAAVNSHMTNIDNSLFGPQLGANIGTTTINNAGGPSVNRYMYQPHIMINQNPLTNSAHSRPYMPMTNMYRLPNQNLAQLTNLGIQKQTLTTSAPTVQSIPTPSIVVQTSLSHADNTVMSNQVHHTEHYEDSSSQPTHENSRPSHDSDKANNADDMSQNEEVFIGVRRKRRYQKYFLSNIDESSTRKGIFVHFEQNGVEIHELNLFRGRNNKCYAQVVVDTKFSEKVESDNFDWPDGIYCTYWRANNKRQERRHNKEKSSTR